MCHDPGQEWGVEKMHKAYEDRGSACMSRRWTVRSTTLPLLCAAGLGLLWLLYRETGSGAAATGPAPAPSAGAPTEPSPLELVEQSARQMVAAAESRSSTGDLDDPTLDAEDGAAGREPGETSESVFYERFRGAAARGPGELEASAEEILRGAGPDAEKVALLRALADCGSERAADSYLLAVRELPDVSDPQGESVASTALLLLDRRAARDAPARAILRRAAFEAPLPPPRARARAAASFFLWATPEELLGARDELIREWDPQVLESALEALSRNPNTGVAAQLLAPHGRVPAVAATEDSEHP